METKTTYRLSNMCITIGVRQTSRSEHDHRHEYHPNGPLTHHPAARISSGHSRSGTRADMLCRSRDLQGAQKRENIPGMVSRHHQRIGANPYCADCHYNRHVHHLLFIRKFRMVYQSLRSVLSTKKLKPYSVLAAATTPFYFLKTDTAKAAMIEDGWKTFIENGKIQNQPNLEGHPFPMVSETKAFFSQSQEFFSTLNQVIVWFQELPSHIAQWSVDLLAWIYKLISSLVLQTPLWLFHNTWFTDLSLVFSSVSIGLIILLTSLESLKQMLRRKHVNFNTILKRLPLAIIGAGAAPYVFEKSFYLLNRISTAITQIGYTEIRSEDILSATKLSGIDTVALIGFDIILILILIPLVLNTGRRWFDLITLGVMTPLALTCWIFDNYRHIFSMWWSNVKHLSLIQLVYASFICIMGIFIFGTRNVMEGYGFYMKLLVVIGGLWRLANPPQFVLRHGDNGKDVRHMVGDLKMIFGKKAVVPFKAGSKFIKKLKPNS